MKGLPADRWVCVHGHFYQPPRENPWLDAIEPQPSAHPYPDWNARITAECYRPNGAARIVDGGGRIVKIVDNYARMSFDVGPTLMSWFEREAPDVHRALVDADARSRARFGGHGSAMAQAYNHLIMPLATPRDQRTQVRWGIADFKYRFGRAPESMWLPECAVDTSSLEALAAEGIQFTVLAPHQARRIRAPGGAWQEAEGNLDTGRVYRCRLPSGRSIDLFFYDGATSQAVAFEKLLVDGARLVDRIVGRGPSADGRPALCHIATDGETYGHHHRYGDMALAWALETVDRGDRAGVTLTNYGEFRARFPAQWEVEVRENSSWSCYHGVERWRADCGCNSGGNEGWRQAWRQPLREALDWLRDRAARIYERGAAGLLDDPWAARDAYIDVVLARTPERIRAFLAMHGTRTLDDRVGLDAPEVVRVLELGELQRHAMLMYTSCGWFFDELSGIETVQVLAYAARVIELAERIGGEALEAGFVERLAAATSNVDRFADGRAVWEQLVRPQRVGLEQVLAHWAVSTAIAGPGEPPEVYCYAIEPGGLVTPSIGKTKLVAGTARVTSQVTCERGDFVFAALHLGEHNLVGGVLPAAASPGWPAFTEEIRAAFASADVAAAQRAIDRAFPGAVFSLGSLFRRERDAALERILAVSLRDAESAFRRIYEDHAPLMRYLVKVGLPVPETFRDAAQLVLRHRILEALREPVASYEDVRACIVEADQVLASLDVPEIAYEAGRALARMIDRFAGSDDPVLLEQLAKMSEVAARMESRVDLWHAQNTCVALREHRLAEWRRRGARGDADAARLAASFARLCNALHVYVE